MRHTTQDILHRWGSHALHLFVLICICLYWWQQLADQREAVAAMAAMGESAYEFINIQNSGTGDRFDYRYTDFYKQARGIMPILEESSTLLDNMMDEQPRVPKLDNYLAQAVDTLERAVNYDTAVCRTIAACLDRTDLHVLLTAYQESAHIKKSAPQELARGLAFVIKARFKLAFLTVFQHWIWLSEPVNLRPDVHIKPIVLPDGPPPGLGRRYTATIYPTPYLPFKKDMTVKVDGKEIPVVNGIAHYRRVFPKPGTYEIAIKIEVPPFGVPRYLLDSPLTERKYYAKLFDIQVW